MSKTFSLLFYLKKAKTDNTGKAPIYCRITVDGQRSELSIKRNVEPSRWNTEKGYVRGTTEDVRNMNVYIDTVRNKLYEHQREVVDKNIVLTADGLKNMYLGIDECKKTVLEIFEYHNEKIKSQIGKDYSVATHKKFIYTLNHLTAFIQTKFKRSDLFLHEINSEFVNEFDYYLRVTKKCNNNTTVKYVKLFKKIINLALAHGWLDKNPFLNYKQKSKEVDREYLLEHELKAIEEKEFQIHRLQQVKDVFVFCCYTGLAYVDVAKLSKENIVLGIDGNKWIKQNRTKTDTRSSIPILPAAEAILERYANDPYCVSNSKLLPMSSNQKMNAYLKEIADLSGITKNCTMHLARHTFATTVTLTNGVPLESVSKMLGHKSVRTTQHYAKIIDRKVSDDMQLLREKFATKKAANNLQKVS
jgi:site-specific recombinase XerD